MLRSSDLSRYRPGDLPVFARPASLVMDNLYFIRIRAVSDELDNRTNGDSTVYRFVTRRLILQRWLVRADHFRFRYPAGGDSVSVAARMAFAQE